MHRTLESRIGAIEQRIQQACARSARDREEVTLVAVSKKKPAELIREAYALGLRDFGESYAQELQAKAVALADLTEIRWHFIGHLQRNKAQQVVGRASLIHSVDSAALLERIDRLAQQRGLHQDVLLQLSLAEEESKSGAPESELEGLAQRAAALEHVRCLGLMTMPPLRAEPEAAAPLFARLRQLRDARPASGSHPMHYLSMGMSHDFEVAIEHGATHVRVGSLIFGPRD